MKGVPSMVLSCHPNPPVFIPCTLPTVAWPPTQCSPVGGTAMMENLLFHMF